MVRRPPVVLGLDFGGTKIAVAVCDLQGNRLASATVGTGAATANEGEDQARTAFQRGVQAARELLDGVASGAELAAVGVSTLGIPYEDRVELAPAIDGWERLALGRELRAAFGGVPVQMTTDAKAAAAAEARWGALHGCDPGVYVNLGTGLSAAIVAGGQVIYGDEGAAGEIGYNLRSVADVGLALGERSMLEETVSGLALARRASAGRGSGQLSAADVFAAADADPALSALVAEFTSELAFHLVNLAVLVNPARIAVGGGIVRSWDRIGPALHDALRAGPPFPPELVVGQFPYDAPLLGAVALAVDAARPSQPGVLHLSATQPGATQPGTTPSGPSPAGEHQVSAVTSGTLSNNTGVEA
jgi:glucokinase